MARGEESGDDGRGGGAYTGASDARLTELLRADAPAAHEAVRELRARHWLPVLAYARLCATSDSAARRLAAQAFSLAAQETVRGTDPHGPWRHRLLLLTVRAAVDAASDERARELDPGLSARLRAAGPEGPVPPMLDAFQSLPSRVQGLVWYAIVEREPEDGTAGLLGLTREDVTYGTEPALQALRSAFLKRHLAASGDPHCQDFRRLIEEAVRADGPRRSEDLRAHMAGCAHCTTAYEELSALRDDPGAALAEGLLPWGGTAYGTAAAARSRTDAPGPRRLRDTVLTWPPSRRAALVSAALGVALVPLVLLLGSAPADTAAERTGGAVPPVPPPVTVTATVPTTPAPSVTETVPTPSPTRSSPPRRVSPSPSSAVPAPPPPSPPDGDYAQVVNLSSGLCLDIAHGEIEKGTDVVSAPCSSDDTQRWRVDTDRQAVQSYADPDFCLDSRGDTDRGVGIWECDSLDGRNGRNLRFEVTSRGVILPDIDSGRAVTPGDGGELVLSPDTGRAEQRWRAGAGPV
ncbi:RICIN domain-containing protein [Streptomyces fructofermentans]|uniref:RICIN domain-containing protein n=1 Tax=Streptomyces fructofermentans TaxID=152141 RepID=UPI0033E59C29